MNAAEYARMDAQEETGWWFASKRLFVHALLQRYGILPLPSKREAGSGTPGREPLILDAGCGTGATLRALRTWTGGPALLLGLDPAPEALAFARQKAGAHLICGSAEELPVRSESLSLVLMLDVLEHLDDDRRAAREVLRVLQPGGHLLVTVPAFPFLWSDHDAALHHRRRYRRAQVREVLEEGGLEVRYLGYIYASVFPAAVVARLARRFRRGAPQADVGAAPALVNLLLIRLMAWESQIGAARPLPFGSSVLALARKPGSGSLVNEERPGATLPE